MQTQRKRFNQKRIEFWNQSTSQAKSYAGFSKTYHKRLNNIYTQNVEPGSKVLEIGCGDGSLLDATSPKRGLGVDFRPLAIEKAKNTFPHFEFHCLDAHDITALDETFDYIILSDIVNDLYDVEEVFRQLIRLCHRDTRILINFHSHLWSWPLKMAQKLGLANKQQQQNWLTLLDVENLLNLSGYELIRSEVEFIFPISIPILTNFINRVVPKIWPLSHLSLTHFCIARCISAETKPIDDSVSIVIAARNESGHIKSLIEQIPKMGRNTEVIFVEGGSTDNTFEEIQSHINSRSDIALSLYQQQGKGKADAIRLGFEKSKNEILMILDADISVLPEDLTRFHRALVSGKGEFINGVRLVYPMQDQAMRFLNLLGNKFFSYGFRFTLGQPIKDTLCGTKVLTKSNYLRITNNRHYFGDFDPFGDFDLIFGAAKLNLKIVDIPIRYQARTYGETNINRWTGGILLLRMLLRSLVKLKFI